MLKRRRRLEGPCFIEILNDIADIQFKDITKLEVPTKKKLVATIFGEY